MSSTFLLSLCIPTYNRARLLEQSLRAVLAQITPALAGDVEVVVLDNASSDSTPEVVAQVHSDFPWVALRSVRRAQNIGPDANFCDAPMQTSGLFLYLLSDDDVLLPGAVLRLLELIRRYPSLDAIALNVRAFQESPEEETRSVYFRAQDCMLQERDAALLFLSTHITFLSCIAFRRGNVLGRDYSPYFATHLAQAYMFLDALAPSQGLYVAKQTYLAQRMDNNQGYNFFEVFVTNFAALMRYAIHAGYSPAAARAALQQHLKYIYHMLLLFKYRGSFGSIQANYADAFRRLWQAYGLNGFVFFVLVPIMVSPAILFPPLQRLYQRIKMRRQARLFPPLL